MDSARLWQVKLGQLAYLDQDFLDWIRSIKNVLLNDLLSVSFSFALVLDG